MLRSHFFNCLGTLGGGFSSFLAFWISLGLLVVGYLPLRTPWVKSVLLVFGVHRWHLWLILVMSDFSAMVLLIDVRSLRNLTLLSIMRGVVRF